MLFLLGLGRVLSQCSDTCVDCYYTPDYITFSLCNTCIDGYFLIFGTCYQCDFTCATCSGPLSNQCLLCASGTNFTRYLNAGTCICGPGFYSASQKSCLPCGGFCQTCSAAGNQCTDCMDDLFRIVVNGACACQSRYKQVLGADICKPCNFPCDTCSSDTVSTPSSCISCRSGYYLDTSVSPVRCQPCNQTCSSCLSSTACLSCKADRNQAITQLGTCICNSRRYEGTSNVGSLIISDCLPCHYSCYTCSSSSKTSCLTCINIQFRTFKAADKTCLCNVGYFESNQICQPCISNCTTCQLNALGSDIVCTACYSGYFVNAATPARCDICTQPCLTCATSATNCLACNNNHNRLLSGGSCNCQDGFFDLAAVQKTYFCMPCKQNCTLCTSLTVCTGCIYGFVLIGTNCVICNSNCLTCTVSATQCVTCDSSKKLMLTVSNTCQCITGFFLSGGICSKCHYSCATCSTSSNSNGCSSCLTASINRKFLVGTSCLCIKGYFDNGVAACAPCHYSCTSCIGSSSVNCIGCDVNSRRYSQTDGSCRCLTGFFDEGYTLCSACPLGCSTCTSATVCQTCVPSFYLNTICLTCHYSCTTCSAGLITDCLTCSLYNRRNFTTGRCNCLKGFFDSTSPQCSQCSYNCVNCQGLSGNCTECTLNKFVDPGSKRCSQCSYKCYTCLTQATNCQTCPANRDKIGSNCICSNSFYENGKANCGKCHASCLTCNGDTQFTCLTCASSRNYKAQYSQCLCLQGTYFDFDGNCQTCGSSCTACVKTSQFCLKCVSGFFFYLSNCLSSCPIYLYGNINQGVCSPCGQNCLYCQDSQNCKQCDSQNFLLDGVCLQACIQPTYLLSTNCIVCANNGYYVKDLECVQECPAGLNPIGQQKKCLECRTSEECRDLFPTYYFYRINGRSIIIYFQLQSTLKAVPTNLLGSFKVRSDSGQAIEVLSVSAQGHFLMLEIIPPIDKSSLNSTLWINNFAALTAADGFQITDNNASSFVFYTPSNNSQFFNLTFEAISRSISLLFLLMFVIACLLKENKFARILAKFPAALYLLAFVKSQGQISNKLFFKGFKYMYLGFIESPLQVILGKQYLERAPQNFVVASVDTNFLRISGLQLLVVLAIKIVIYMKWVFSPKLDCWPAFNILLKESCSMLQIIVILGLLSQIINQNMNSVFFVSDFRGSYYLSLVLAYLSMIGILSERLIKIYFKTLRVNSFRVLRKVSGMLALVITQFYDAALVTLVMLPYSLFTVLALNCWNAFLMRDSKYVFQHVLFSLSVSMIQYIYLIGDDRNSLLLNLIILIVILLTFIAGTLLSAKLIPWLFGMVEFRQGGDSDMFMEQGQLAGRQEDDGDGRAKKMRKEYIPVTIQRNRLGVR